MGYTITIDAGTTNTRACLWTQDRTLAASAGAEIGVHHTAMDGNPSRLKQAVKDCLAQLLIREGIGWESVSRILASGMITSNVGLMEVPHALAPAGTEELAKGSREVLMAEICPVPICFIPGVKNNLGAVTSDNFQDMDMMRGEEVETLGMLHSLPGGKDYLLVLPGSHTKFVATDDRGRITGCLTTISGELLDCITNRTVIADAVGRSFVSEESYHREMVLRGFESARNTGLGRAAFSARVLNQFAEKDKQKIANFVLGAVLAGDVQSICYGSALNITPDAHVVVSGRNPLRRAIVDVLKHDGYFAHVEEYVPAPGMSLSAMGSFLVADQLTAIG